MIQSKPDWQLLGEYFDALCELEPDARVSELERIRAEHPQIAAQLEPMLAADARSGVLDQGVEAIAAATVALSATDRSGQQFGEFVLLERIGRGGMGEVYRAERRGGDFAQKAAIKLLRLGLDGADAERRFALERRILARLEHPGIARLIDGGMGADGLPWLAMELVDGQPLTTYAQTAALGLDARLQLIIDVCAAVDYAHRRLVVHRDLKPSNVLVEAQGRVKLLDFGIAKLLDEDDAAALTGTGVRLMSPAYAAPEQILGEAISTATDVYALGLLLCELLTARLPQKRGQQSLEALARSLDTDALDRPSALVGTSARAIPARLLEGDLDTIICKALSREPERRYASAAALAEDLERFRQGRPIAARPDTLGYRMGKFVRRHRGSVGASVLALLAILIGFGVALWQADVARTQARIAKTQSEHAQAQAERAERIKDFLIALFKEQEPVGRAGAQQQTPLGLIESGIVSAQRDLVDDPELRDEVLGDLADVEVNLGGADAAQPLLDSSLKFRREHYGNQHLLVAQALASQITATFQKGKFTEAEPLIVEAQHIFTAKHGPEHISVANMQNRMVRVLISQTRFEEAATLMREVVRKTELKYGPNNAEVGLRLSNLGVVLAQQGQADTAQDTLTRAISILESARGKEHAALLFPLNTLGDLQRKVGNNAAAVLSYERAVAIARIQLGERHPRYAVALQRVGNMQRLNGQLEEAERTLDRAREIQEEGRYAELADTYSRLADVAAERNDSDSAVLRRRQAWEHALATQGPKNMLTWTRQGAYALALADAGQLENARALLVETSAGLDALGDPARVEAAMQRVLLGSVQRQLGDLDRAIELQSGALEAALAHIPDAADPRLDSIRIELALSRLLRGDAADLREAPQLLDQAERVAEHLSPRLQATSELARALQLTAAQDLPGAAAMLDRADQKLVRIGTEGRWLQKCSEELRLHLPRRD